MGTPRGWEPEGARASLPVGGVWASGGGMGRGQAVGAAGHMKDMPAGRQRSRESNRGPTLDRAPVSNCAPAKVPALPYIASKVSETTTTWPAPSTGQPFESATAASRLSALMIE